MRCVGSYDKTGARWLTARGHVTLRENEPGYTDVVRQDVNEVLLWRVSFVHAPRAVIMSVLAQALDEISALVPVEEVTP